MGDSYKPAGTEVLISAAAHNTPPPFQAAQNATTVNTRSSVAPCTARGYIYFAMVTFILPWLYDLFVVGGLGFEFCVFVAGWRHALRSEWPFIINIINT